VQNSQDTGCYSEAGMAAKIVIEPVFEADFQPCSYGFRPKRSAKQAMDRIFEVADKGGALWVIDADIRDYFGSINHDKLLLLVKQRITDRRVLKLIKGWLKAGVLENGQYSESTYTWSTTRRSYFSTVIQHISELF
jgi:RNA-directed DNA polymerase